MNKFLLSGLVASVLFGGPAGAIAIAPGDLEVVVAANAQPGRSAAYFAAQELTNFLSRAFVREIPLVRSPTAGKTAIIVGTNTWSVAAGIDIANLPRDAFRIKTAPGRIYLVGRDEPDFKLVTGARRMEHGTLTAAYDFLERFVGCHFYFPGELGEVVPRVTSLEVPETDLVNAPDYTVREMSHDLGAWFDPVSASAFSKICALQAVRYRHQTRRVPCCHGQYKAKIVQRFGKTHPEYFYLNSKGVREIVDSEEKPLSANAHLCYTSAVWEELYKDARSYFLGEGPEVRGMIVGKAPKHKPGWGAQAAFGEYYDIMPQDGMRRCTCPTCTETFARARDQGDYANETVWGHVVDIANRLKAEGIKGTLTMMSYTPYRAVPPIDIPDNVAVMVCCNGSWVTPEREARDTENIRQWTVKRNGKVWIWNNTGKHRCSRLNIEDLPSCTPHAFGRYYKKMAPLIFGAYCSNNSEKFLYSAINYYVYAKVSWDNKTDVDALLDEYYRLMFGAAAVPMREVFELIEQKWMTEVLGTTVETAVGAVTCAPSEFKVWTQIYSPKVVEGMTKMFERAAVAVPADSLEGRRVALFRREFLEPMRPHIKDYMSTAVEVEKARRAANPKPSAVVDFKPVVIDVADTNRPFVAAKFRLDVKPGKTYRVSYFVRGKDIRPFGRFGGAQSVSWKNEDTDKTFFSPKTGMEGTFDWMHSSYIFRVPKGGFDRFRPEIDLRLFKAFGHVEFDGLVVEALTPAEIKQLSAAGKSI